MKFDTTRPSFGCMRGPSALFGQGDLCLDVRSTVWQPRSTARRTRSFEWRRADQEQDVYGKTGGFDYWRHGSRWRVSRRILAQQRIYRPRHKTSVIIV